MVFLKHKSNNHCRIIFLSSHFHKFYNIEILFQISGHKILGQLNWREFMSANFKRPNSNPDSGCRENLLALAAIWVQVASKIFKRDNIFHFQLILGMTSISFMLTCLVKNEIHLSNVIKNANSAGNRSWMTTSR